MIIDIHGHIGRSGPRPAEIAALRSHLDRCKIERLLISNLAAASQGDAAQAQDETDANIECLWVARADPRFTPLYWLRPGRPDSNPAALAGALLCERFVGAVLAPHLNGVAADDPLLDAWCTALVKAGRPLLVYTARADAARPARTLTLARRHPQLPFVLYSAAADGQWSEAVDCARLALQGHDATLLLDTAHAEADEIVLAVNALGAERVLFGSDAVAHGPEHAARAQGLLDALAQRLPREAWAKVCGGNAARLFGGTSGY